jgi:hypothetical protein
MPELYDKESGRSMIRLIEQKRLRKVLKVLETASRDSDSPNIECFRGSRPEHSHQELLLDEMKCIWTNFHIN